MGKFSKKPKHFYFNQVKHANKNQRYLQSNMKGFICTCLSNEKRCAKEAIRLLEQFAKKIEPIEKKDTIEQEDDESKNDSTSDESDIESDLNKELEKLKQKSELPLSDTSAQFYEARVSVHNCIFIATSIENPVDLSLAIMNDVIRTKDPLTSSVIRLTPVQKTCKAFIENIDKAAQEVMETYLQKDLVMSFCIIVNIRNNAAIKKEELVSRLSLFACNHNKKLKVNTRNPDVVLNIDILKNICCLAFLPDYLTKFHKYNLNKIAAVAALADSKKEESQEL